MKNVNQVYEDVGIKKTIRTLGEFLIQVPRRSDLVCQPATGRAISSFLLARRRFRDGQSGRSRGEVQHFSNQVATLAAILRDQS